MSDVQNRADIEEIVAQFYVAAMSDPIIGFIFTDIAKIDLPAHLPTVVDFWDDVVFQKQAGTKVYSGNPLAVHLKLAEKLALRPGHFTRWLYLFHKALAKFSGPNADLMSDRAESVAKSISAALVKSKRGNMKLTLGRS